MLDCVALDTRYKPQIAQSSSVKKKTVLKEVIWVPLEYWKLFTKLIQSTLTLDHIEYQFLYKRSAHTKYRVFNWDFILPPKNPMLGYQTEHDLLVIKHTRPQ